MSKYNPKRINIVTAIINGPLANQVDSLNNFILDEINYLRALGRPLQSRALDLAMGKLRDLTTLPPVNSPVVRTLFS